MNDGTDNLGATHHTAREVRHARRALNHLIIACEEDILVGHDAEHATPFGPLTEQLRTQARRRAGFVKDIQTAVVTLGGRPSRVASGLARIRWSVRHLRAFVGGWHEGDAFAAIADAEARTAKAYRRALSGWLPEDARLVTQRQLAEIDSDLDRARTQRGQH